ncbi:hypothetical protein ACWDYH_02965 [Nocardia goodfellowii]
MDRLSVVDEIFLRTHRGLGTPIALQGLWRTADRIDPALLARVHAALRVGQLGRRVIRPRVPGARRAWRSTTRACPLDYAMTPIPAAALLDWADAQGSGLDPEFGPGWRLSAAALDDGGTVVSLTCSHALADGRGLVHAVNAALATISTVVPSDPGSDPVCSEPNRPSARHSVSALVTPASDGDFPVPLSNQPSGHYSVGALETPAAYRNAPTSPSSPPSVHQPVSAPETPAAYRNAPVSPSDQPSAHQPVVAPGTPVPDRNSPVSQSDWADALRQWSIVIGGTARALRRGIPERPTSVVPNHPPGQPDPHSAILRCRRTEWDGIAVGQGGTANSLFVWLVANVLWATGFPHDTIEASLPVDTRTEPRTDNDLAMTSIGLSRADDAASIREKARAAYEHRMSSPGGMPEELLQVIPDRWAYRLSRGAGERDILCSNIGSLPDTLSTLGPHACTGVAARAIHPGLRHLPRTRLSAYLCDIGDYYTLAVVSLDPAIESATALIEIIDTVAARLGIPMSPW